jgi:UDP-N-acetylglucosamine 2-epimerase (non-hydrolysing)
MIKAHLIAAARPNFMKVAPLYHAMFAQAWCEPILIHTGQHYDVNMSDAFFTDLRLPEPNHHLGVGSGSHAEQTAGVMVAYEKLCMAERPDMTIVFGDVNSTIACALAAKKLLIQVGHVEAGLRSRDWTMPEEVNRIVTDSISDVLWTPSDDGDENLRAEGVAEERISRVGNIMIDSYELLRPSIESANVGQEFGLKPGSYAVVTLHRPSNVDEPDVASDLVATLIRLAADVPLVFAVHPRTRKNLTSFGLLEKLDAAPGVHLAEPMSYIRFMSLVSGARLIITDSGGLQEETTYLNIPCLTLRPNTERPITISQGTNRLARPEEVGGLVDDVLNGNWPDGVRPALWDGRTASRIVDDLARRMGANVQALVSSTT